MQYQRKNSLTSMLNMASIFLNNQIFQIPGDFILETIMCFSKTELLSHASKITQAHLEEVTSEFIKDE